MRVAKSIELACKRAGQLLGTYAARYPRSVCALTFGGITTVGMYLSWVPAARTSGMAFAFTVAAGLSHAVAGSITGPRLLDGARTRSPFQAATVGAVTSLMALALFSPVCAVILYATGVHPTGLVSYLSLPVMIAFFGFLAGGWALLLLSIGAACALYGMTHLSSGDETRPGEV